MLPENMDFTIEIIQGRSNSKPTNTFYPFSSKRYDLRGLIRDYPSGYLFYSKQFTPFTNTSLFKQYFNLFTYTFKIVLTPLLDRSNYIILNDNNTFLIETKEKVCSEHLNAIKETLPPHKQEKFTQYIDYNAFVKSDYKSIKYMVISYHGFVEVGFEILYRMNNDFNSTLQYDTYTLGDEGIKYGGMEVFNTMLELKSNRYLEGVFFNFENLVFNHNITFNKRIGEIVNRNEQVFEIIEMLPSGMLQPLYSTLKICVYMDEGKMELDYEMIAKYFNVSIREGEEERYVAIPFTYENKRMTQLNIKYIGGLGVMKRMEVSLEMRKTILNFEAMDNEMEFAYLFPCGLIVLGNNYTVTNNIYYNFPNIDVTMPFNLIAITWVVFGFMIVQILNIFLGKRGKSIIDTLKERFMAKWGFLFGK